MNASKGSVFSNLIWRLAERVGAKAVEFVVSIVLARLLLPEDYGTIALITVFITILQVFIDNGIGNSLIQKKDADSIDFSTVFYFNLCFCAVLYLILFFGAPLISDFYSDANMAIYVRVLGITILISSVKNIEQAYVSRHLQFKKFFFATLFGTVGAAIIGIYMAYHGYGVWSLIFQQLFNAALDTIILWIIVPWRPTLQFSFIRLKAHISYGWKILVSSLLDTVYTNIRQLIIGKMYTSSDLAFYNRGRQFPSFIVTNINSSIDSVLFPAMSREQDNIDHIKYMTRWSIKVSTYVMAPLMMGLAFAAEPIVRLVLTEKWPECVPYLRIFCITFMFYPIHTANLNSIKAIGRSDVYLKLEIAKKIVGFACLVSTMWFGVMAMAYSMLLISVLSQIINSWPNRKLLKYSYLEQMKDIIPYILLSVIMGLIIYFIKFIGLSDLLTVILQVLLGGIIYWGISMVMKIDAYSFMKNIVKLRVSLHKGKK